MNRWQRLVLIPAAVVALAPAACDRSGDCVDGNPLMPTCGAATADEPRVVFVSNRHDPMREDRLQVYSMTARGTDIRQLTSGLPVDVPRWSPDGQRIAYGELAPPRASLIVMNADGSNPVNISRDNSVADGFPAWSPDGRRIAFHSNRHNLQGGTLRSIYVMNDDGSNVVRLTHNNAWNDRSPHWSPDGSRITFMSNRVGGVFQIFVMNADGSDVRQLTTTGTNLWPNWSPDGHHISFSSLRSTNGVPDNGLYIMNADGSEPRNLTKSGTMHDMFSTWSADASEIYFCSTRTGMHIWKVRVADGAVLPVTSPGGMAMEAVPNLQTRAQSVRH